MTDVTKTKISVLGAGAWGVALAQHLANAGQQVILWGRSPDKIATLDNSRVSTALDCKLKKNFQLTSELDIALKFSHNIIIAIPSHAFKKVLQQVAKYNFNQPLNILSASKGLDPETRTVLSEVAKNILPNNAKFSVLAGPSFAKEVVRNLPTCVTIANSSETAVRFWQQRLNFKRFRAYISLDVIGTEVGGVVKNVLAIAAGISDGMNMGANARAALITRGLQEMLRLALNFGANQQTLMGLSGVGDLILTCTDKLSRNYCFGFNLGSGKSLEQSLNNLGQVAEGFHNVALVWALARTHKIDMPITEKVYQVIHGEINIQQAISELFSREATFE